MVLLPRYAQLNRAHHASRLAMRTRVGLFICMVIIMRKRFFPVKPAKTYEEQLAILRDRGLIIPNESEALDFLKTINYYRLSGYRLTLRVPNSEQFEEGTTFDHLRGLYEFDRRLRSLLIAVLESVEVAFRTRVAYELAHKYGPIGYKNASHFSDTNYHHEFLTDLNSAINRGSEVFIRHHETKYGGQLPIWVAVELASFGAVSKLFRIMSSQDQRNVASYYNKVHPPLLITWVHTAVYLRNICAHYGRLYNRHLKVTPRLLKRWRGIFPPNSLFAGILVIRELCPSESQWFRFIDDMGALVREYDAYVDLVTMGFPAVWRHLLKAGKVPKTLA